MRSFLKYFVNCSSFAIQLGSQCRYQTNDCRGVFRTKSNSYDGALGENNQWPKAVNYFCKKAPW